MITYQDYERKVLGGQVKLEDFLIGAINTHISSTEYQTCIDANNYDKQQNTTIKKFVKYMYSATGRKQVDNFSSNAKICSNFFHRLNTQRNTYLLGNGVQFSQNKRRNIDQNTGAETIIDATKEMLGNRFDTDLKNLGFNALIHGVSFGFWDYNRLKNFTLENFVPLWDEDTYSLRAGIRFWKIDADKPLHVVFYEVDGFTKFKQKKGEPLLEVEPKKGYIKTTTESIDGGQEEVTYSNYPNFPIIPLWGSRKHQSTLVGMKESIDAFDLIKSGFIDDVHDCSAIYWLISGADGMDAREKAEFLQRLRLNHIANVDDKTASVTPYTQEVPTNAREISLQELRNGIYEDFGALDVHTISASSTNDHIDAAYQPLDEEADDYEFQVIEFMQNLLELLGVEDTPVFKRNRISNQAEMTNMILSAAEYLDNETILSKLPFVTADEVSQILAKKIQEMSEQLEMQQTMASVSEDESDNEEIDNDEEDIEE